MSNPLLRRPSFASHLAVLRPTDFFGRCTWYVDGELAATPSQYVAGVAGCCGCRAAEIGTWQTGLVPEAVTGQTSTADARQRTSHEPRPRLITDRLEVKYRVVSSGPSFATFCSSPHGKRTVRIDRRHIESAPRERPRVLYEQDASPITRWPNIWAPTDSLHTCLGNNEGQGVRPVGDSHTEPVLVLGVQRMETDLLESLRQLPSAPRT